MYCPYCFSDMDEVSLICMNPGCEERDQIANWQPRRMLEKIPDRWRIRGGRYLAEKNQKCASCGSGMRVICEKCGKSIPFAWARYPYRSILILGEKRAGKSTLLANSGAALGQLENLAITPLEPEETGERFYEKYTREMQASKGCFPSTPDGVPVPFLWGLTQRENDSSCQILVTGVYDVPGGMVEHYADTQPVRTLLSKTDCAVLVINPASLPALYPVCGAGNGVAYSPDGWARAERILDSLLGSGELGTRIGAAVSVVFTHADLWFPKLTGLTSMEQLTDSCLRSLARQWGGGIFLSRLGECAQSHLFATGVYIGDEVLPLDGTEKPVIWLLKQMGMNLE